MAASPESFSAPHFDATLARHGLSPIRRESVRTIQVNVGKLCNQACHHCHVDAGPKRTEVMTRASAERVADLLEASMGIRTVDVTGGAPELNPNFTYIVERARAAERAVMVRCNLTVIFVPGMEWLAKFYRDNRVHLVCSLPCYTAENVEKQRGRCDCSTASVTRATILCSTSSTIRSGQYCRRRSRNSRRNTASSSERISASASTIS